MLINTGLRHFHLRTSDKKDITGFSKARLVNLIDNLVYIGGAAGVILAIPQLAKIWLSQNVAGLSLITWLGFLASTIFWLAYGFLHRVKPIFFINLAFSIINLFIVIGIIIFS